MKSINIVRFTAIAIAVFSAASLQAQLPDPGLTIDPERTALVVTDPQNDFLSPEGVTWGVVGKSVEANGTVANIESLLKSAKKADMPVFVSPHYYYPTDHGWQFGGAVETMMHGIKMFDRKGALTTEGFDGSGADWLAVYKPYLEDGKTVVTSPHKVYGPETNDLVLQLRKRGIDKVILAGIASARVAVGQSLHRVASARVAGAGFRSRGGDRRDGGGAGSRPRRLRRGAGELPLPGERRVDDRRSGRENWRRRAGSIRIGLGLGIRLFGREELITRGGNGPQGLIAREDRRKRLSFFRWGFCGENSEVGRREVGRPPFFHGPLAVRLGLYVVPSREGHPGSLFGRQSGLPSVRTALLTSG